MIPGLLGNLGAIPKGVNTSLENISNKDKTRAIAEKEMQEYF